MKLVLVFSFIVLVSGCASQMTEHKSDASGSTNNLSMLPDQTLFVEVTLQDGNVTSLNSVDEVQRPEATLTFDFSSMSNGMMLSVKNPFDKPIKYHLNMIDRLGKKYQTSSCPVMPEGSVFESWPHPIPKLEISNIHFAEDDEMSLCTY